MKEHKRRNRYWEYYHQGHTSELAFLIETLLDIIRTNPCPREPKSGRGRPPIHSDEKMDFICFLMVGLNFTYRETER